MTSKLHNSVLKYVTFSLVIFFIFSCQSSLKNTPIDVLEIDNPLVKDAKSYYDSHYLNGQRNSRQGAASKKNFKPDWKSAKSKNTSFGDIVEIPITLDNRRVAYTSKSNINSDKISKSEQWRVNSISTLFMFRAKDSQTFSSQINTLTENVSSEKKKANLDDINLKNFHEFSGFAFYESLDDNSIKGYQVDKGKIIKHFTSNEEMSNKRLANLQPGINCRPETFNVWVNMCYPDSQGNYTDCSWEYAGSFQGQLCDENIGEGTISNADITNCEEQVINAIGVIATIKIYQAKLIAEQLTAQRYGTSFCDNDCCNAFKHAMWMAKSAASVGAIFAMAFGMAHECEQPVGSLSRTMDIHNNAMGIAIGAALYSWTPTIIIEEAIEIALNNGVLKRISNGIIINTTDGC